MPAHIAIIMDGNGRWAASQFLTKENGYQNGAQRALSIIDDVISLGIKYLTLYAFSMENWGRDEKEVECLFSLFVKYLAQHINELVEKGVRLAFIGEINMLPPQIQQYVSEAHKVTKHNRILFLNIAISYGGRQEILNAVRKIVAQNISPEQINNTSFRDFLYTHGIPDPDLVIRTGGEKRLSNFLLWQSAYSELYFCDETWPEFNRACLINAINDYKKRVRKYGK